jgi:ArsR family transcriptional regulator
MDESSLGGSSTLEPTPPEHLDELTQLFRALGDPVRLRILLMLTAGERNVTSLCDATGLAQPTVSHHLGILRSASLAEGRRSGKSIYYSAGSRVLLDAPDSVRLQTKDSPPLEVHLRAERAEIPAKD